MKRPLKRLFSGIAIASILLVSSPATVEAQCPMCRMAAESNLNQGGTAGKGLNKGILMLLSMPYVLVGGVAFVWYRNRRKEEEGFIEESFDVSKWN